MKERFEPRYAAVEKILEVKESTTRLPFVHDGMPGGNLAKFAKLEETPIHEGDDGYLYVRARAISSRVNKNNDGWPSEELSRAYKTFMGRPIFVDHNNEDFRRARGVIVDSRLHVEDEKTSALDPYYSTAPDNHKPPTWIELLMEVDAKTYPKLARAIKTGDVDAVSMGANIERSICSVCANEATSPSQYCDHVKSKGATFEITSDDGGKIKKRAYEDCEGVNFFEISFVFDPADETAKIGKEAAATGVNAPAATDEEDRQRNHIPQSEQTGAPAEVDTLRDELRCKNCEADHYTEDSDGIMRCPTCGNELEPHPLDNPDLTKADGERANEVDESGTQQNADDQITFDDGDGSGTGNSFIEPIQPIKGSQAAGEINEMKFETTLETTSRSEVDKIAPVTAARQEMLVGYPGGIHGGTHQALLEAGLNGQVTYPDGTTLPLPGPANQHFKSQIMYKRANGLKNLADVPVTLEFPDDQLPAAAAIVQAGGPARTAATEKKVLKPGTKPTNQPKDVKVVSDQNAPVESKLTLKDDDMEKEADRRKIVRTEHPDGSKTEEIVEESGDLAFAEDKGEQPKDEASKDEATDEKSEPETEEGEKDEKKQQLPFAASVEDAEKKLLAAFALADEAVEMKLIAKEQKLAFVARLEKESMAEIKAREDMLRLTKEAGLSKTPKVAGIRNLPRVAATSNNGNSSEFSDDAQLFL